MVDKWEYMSGHMTLEGIAKPTDPINVLGADGWELVSVAPMIDQATGYIKPIGYFKRRVQSPAHHRTFRTKVGNLPVGKVHCTDHPMFYDYRELVSDLSSGKLRCIRGAFTTSFFKPDITGYIPVNENQHRLCNALYRIRKAEIVNAKHMLPQGGADEFLLRDKTESFVDLYALFPLLLKELNYETVR